MRAIVCPYLHGAFCPRQKEEKEKTHSEKRGKFPILECTVENRKRAFRSSGGVVEFVVTVVALAKMSFWFRVGVFVTRKYRWVSWKSWNASV